MRDYDAEEGLREFMKARGLEAWHGHLTKHLDIKTPSQLKAITAIDLRRMATSANMRLDQKTIDQVLQAIRPKGTVDSESDESNSDAAASDGGGGSDAEKDPMVPAGCTDSTALYLALCMAREALGIDGDDLSLIHI